MHGGKERWGGWPGTVNGKFKHGQRTSKLFPPVGHVAREGLCLDHPTLPLGIVCILDGQLRDRRWLARDKSLVQRGQLRQEYLVYRDTIANDMAQRQKQAMLFVAQPD